MIKYFLGGFLLSIISVTTPLIPAVLAAETAPPSIVITEIGAYERDNSEWIEIYNFGAAPIDLTGWTFWDTDATRLARHTITLFQGDDFILAPQEYAIIAEVAATTRAQYPSLAGVTIFDSAWDTLKETGEEIALKDSAGAIVENILPFYLPAPDASLERRDPMLRDYTENNWTEREEGNSIGAANTGSAPPEEEPPPPPEADPPLAEAPTATSTPATSPNKSLQPVETVKQYASGVVIINEFVSDPAEGEEWVELYNNSTEIIEFAKWTLEDGNETATALAGTLAPHQFLVIEKPKGQLNNSGDLIVLMDGTGKTIDRVAYGDWADEFVNDNAPAAKDPLSVARIQDGRDSNNDALDFATTETPTKGGPNVITNEQTKTVPRPSQPTTSSTLTITEFLPNPIGPDAEGEFIELYNPTAQPVSFRDFALRDKSGKTFSSTTLVILPLTHFALSRTSTNIALNNSGGETVILLDQDDRALETVSFTGSSAEGASYARSDTGIWRWTNKPTPGAPNNFTTINNPPIAVIDAEDEALVNTDILFDASDSSDTENDPLKFHWDFGDGEESAAQNARHSYEAPGAFTVVLSVSDNELMSKTAHVIHVLSAISSEDGVGGPAPVNFSALRITEFMPNPEGSDDAEWIELFNAGTEPIALDGIKLDDEEGGSRGFTVNEDAALEPGVYRVFGRQETKIALNNTSDEARLFDPFDQLLASIPYDDVTENASYAVDKKGAWHWTSTPTPGDPNVITPLRERASAARATKTTARRTAKPLKITPLESVRDLDIGDRVQTTGVVAVLPGILGSQIFYIVTPSTTAGIQIYSYNKTFPQLNIGDRVEITGTLSQAREELRIKTQEASDIHVVEPGVLTLPHTIPINQLTDEHEGALVKIAGTITQRLQNKVYLDDGTDELLIYIKDGVAIARTALMLDEHAEITGIVSKLSSGLRLLPRGPEDITIIPASSVPEVSRDAPRQTASSNNALASFLAAAAGTLASLLVALIAKSRFGKKDNTPI
ncbi:MAG: lamin tail domain-containing protein [Candidatus Magasanikbacteria bacterium]|nr:lamin tail domain-containing protein [Candidatus Magasanikbacteria bacterium]